MKVKLTTLSWKKKNQALMTGLTLVLLLVFRFAIGPTLEVRTRCKELEEVRMSSVNAPAEAEMLRAQLAEFRYLTNEQNPDDSSAHHEQLLALITGYCSVHDLTLRDFPAALSYRRDEWLIETHRATVEGNFMLLVQFLDHLHRNCAGKIISAGFSRKKDNKTKTTALQLTVYVQHIRTAS